MTEPLQPPTPRILLVDDDLEVCQFLKLLLELEGFETRAAQTAEEAIAQLKEPTDLLLLDIAMPGLDGIDLCRRLKADPRTARIPVVIVSARPGAEVVARAREAGADDFIRKPFENEELVEQVRKRLAPLPRSEGGAG